MRHLRPAVAVAVTAAWAAATPAVAAPTNERACFGTFASSFAQANPASGQLVSQAAQASVPFGAGVSQAAQCAGP